MNGQKLVCNNLKNLGNFTKILDSKISGSVIVSERCLSLSQCLISLFFFQFNFFLISFWRVETWS